ncbi:MAG: hypothetical protein ACLQER_18445 [Streptosporangiaceae bacterium]
MRETTARLVASMASLLGCFSIFFGILPPLPAITRFTFAGDVRNVQRGRC